MENELVCCMIGKNLEHQLNAIILQPGDLRRLAGVWQYAAEHRTNACLEQLSISLESQVIKDLRSYMLRDQTGS